MFVPLILGSDKTTVSVGTGNNEYWPLYLSIGNIHGNVRHAHQNGLVLLGFLAIPKSECNSIAFHIYRSSFWCSEERICKWCRFSQVLPPTVSFIPCQNSQACQARNDNTQGGSLSWWSLQTCNLQSWSLHHWLPRASTTCMHRTGVVSKVSFMINFANLLLIQTH